MRNQFADWLVHTDNPRFAAAIANRLWKKVFGVAVQEPVTDIDDPSLASNPELLNQITQYMKQAKFDLREFQRILFHTAAYQRASSHMPEDPRSYRFAGPVVRRMGAEQVWDSIVMLTAGTEVDQILLRRGDIMTQFVLEDNQINADAVREIADKFMENRAMQRVKGGKGNKKNVARAVFYEGGVPQNRNGLILTRASETQQPAPENHFLRLFGQSDRLVSDTNTVDGSIPQLLQLMNGPIQEMVTDRSYVMSQAAKATKPEEQITSLYMSFLSRKPHSTEMSKSLAALKDGLQINDIAWVLLNSREFLFVP